MPLIYLSCSWIAGIFLGSKFALSAALIPTCLMPLPLIFVFRRYQKPIILVSLCTLALIGGALFFRSTLPPNDGRYLQFYNGQGNVSFKGIINTDPEIRENTVHIQLSATDIKVDGEWQEVSGTALLFVPRYPAYEYGDVLLVTGKLETPSPFVGFNYQEYLARQGIYSTVLYPAIEILDRGKGFKPLAWVYSIRNGLSQILAEILPEPQASLAQGIILGKRGTIPQELQDSFTRTGTAHLLAISGLHLSIVAGILLAAGIWLFGRRHYTYIWLTLGATWFYALLSGMNPPVVRAAIMLSLFLIAEFLGRQRSAITALAFAAAVMIGINPQILWTASFQLSFLAMAGLIFIVPPLQAIGRKLASKTAGENRGVLSVANIITSSLAITLGVVIAVWPVVAHYFGIISLVGPFATVLALPALPAIIFSGTMAGALGLITLTLAYPIGWLAWLFVSYLLLVVNFFAALPISAINVGAFDATLIGVYYFLLVLAIWLNNQRGKLADIMPQATSWIKSTAGSVNPAMLPKKWLVPALLVTATLIWAAVATIPDDNLHVTFLDVGEGDAILIQTPAHQDILVDGGPNPQLINLELSQKMPFWDRTLDLVILTHPHADHLNGLTEVLRRYKVKQVLYSDLAGDSPLSGEWRHLIKEEDIKYTIAQAGQQISCGEKVVIEVLSSGATLRADTKSNIDNSGVVLRLSMGHTSFLLTADIFRELEFELIKRRANLNSTVLKVAHHGSDTSTASEFLSLVKPQVAVISSGADNTYGHPHDEVMDNLTGVLNSDKIYLTSERGTIEFITDGNRLWLQAEK